MPSYLTLPGNSTASSFTLVNGPSSVDTNESLHELEGMEPSQQLEALDNHLMKQTRIMEGAEKMLSVQMAESLRHQVETELSNARSRIQALTDRKHDIQTTLSKEKQLNGKKNLRLHAHSNSRSSNKEDNDERDDFRTALQSAQTLVSSLMALGRPQPASPPPSTSANPPPSTPAELDQRWVDTMQKLINVMQRNLRVCYEIDVAELVRAVVPALADKRSKQCRATAYRLVRHSLVDPEAVKRLGEQNLDWYIVKSLTRDSKYAVEKEQVIKLIRTVVEVGTTRPESPGGLSGSVPLSEPVMRAFIAVAEHVEDVFRPICIQTLAEILLIDIDLVARTGGIRFLLHALGEGPVELTPILASAFLHIVDSPRTREYINVGTDLEMALAAVTDAYGKGPDHEERMRSCTKVIQLMLRNWSGLMYFCMDDMRAIRSIIDTLRIPSLETREIILKMFFDLLNIKTPAWYQTFIDGRRLTMYRKSRDPSERWTDPEPTDRVHQTLKLTDQYIALLVLVFTHAGLIDALASMLEESTTGSNLSRNATLLIAEVLQMANRVLPLSVAAQIQAVPQIFTMASDYTDGEHRIVGTSAMSAIDSFNRNKARLEPAAVKNSRPRANSVEDAVRRGQRQVEQVKLKMGMQMDDKTFQSSLLESQVMLTKDHAKWNFETLQELIEGPLLNPKRMEEAIKGARFIRRLMSFFHPFSHRFSDMPRIKANERWVKLGCTLLTTLLASPDGLRYLSTEDQLLPQIMRGFLQLDPHGPLESDPIFSKKRTADTLTYGYVDMLGTLSKHKDGIELLEKFKIFTAFYHISELKSREDLIKIIIQNLDYNIDGHPRIVLSKALTSSYQHVRMYATQHLGELIRASATANAWTLRLLLTQLYDPAAEVCERAVHFLEEACESKDILQLVVEMRPSMDHLGEIGNPLLLKFVSTPTGFRYLYDMGYIDREMDLWFNERNLFYVVQVEVFLAKVFNSFNVAEDDEDTAAFEGTVPPHFYGEMSKTELGCQILQDKGHFTEFAEFIRQHGNESEDQELIMKLKSILWAVGNVGATEGGLPFLEDEEIIPAVLKIADESPIPSVRGTCFFVLGLISSTLQGAELLDDYQWEATLTPTGMPTGLCIPMDLEKFIYIPPWTQRIPEATNNRLIPPTAEAEVEIVTAMQNLANTVIANAASRSLARMKSRPEHRALFSSPAMMYRALHTISTQRYRLPVRRYILEMFNVELDADVVANLNECAQKLKPHPTDQPSKPQVDRKSMFGRLGRIRRHSESDDDEVDELDVESPPNIPADGVPALSLRPVSRIIGFDL